MSTTDRVAILDKLTALQADLDAGTYMEWTEPLPRGRKGMDHSSQRPISVLVGGEPRNPANLPASTSLDRSTMAINLEALKQFTRNTRYGIDWKEEPFGNRTRVTIVIRSPQTYDAIGWELMRAAMNERSGGL